MRNIWRREPRWVLVAMALAFGLLMDEEPLSDLTDWSALQVGLWALAFLVVIVENVTRARYGQVQAKDVNLAFSTFSHWFFLETYFRLVLILFCLHCLVPGEAELLELMDVYQTMLTWVTLSLTYPTLLLGCALGIAQHMNATLRWSSWGERLALATLVVLALAGALFFVAWDLLFGSLTAQLGRTITGPVTTAYGRAASALAYDAVADLNDQFDWHREQVRPFVMRFEDLYCFFLQLLNFVALATALYTWLILWVDLVRVRGGEGVSFTFLAVASRWLEHIVIVVMTSHVGLFYVGTRLFLSTPIDWLIFG